LIRPLAKAHLAKALPVKASKKFCAAYHSAMFKKPGKY